VTRFPPPGPARAADPALTGLHDAFLIAPQGVLYPLMIQFPFVPGSGGEFAGSAIHDLD
jgi:hypothetical protein